jgi:DNA-binding MarR family transcriptional regulator
MTSTSPTTSGEQFTDRAQVDQALLALEIERLLTAGIAITAIAIDQTEDAADLTLAQWRALVVAGRNESVRVGELATNLGMSVPSASRLVRRIEARGLVTARRAEDDRRATNVRLTAGGRRLVEAVVGRRRALIGRALAGGADARSGTAVATLREIADRLEVLA